MRRRHSRLPLQSQINVVPYLDVLLVLLVIFMVTAPLLSQSVIDVPTAGDTGTTQSNDAIEIQLPENGGYRVKDYNFGGEETSFTTLDDAMLLVAERRNLFPDAPVLISADRNLPYEKVVEVLSDLQERGLSNVGLVTQTGQ